MYSIEDIDQHISFLKFKEKMFDNVFYKRYYSPKSYLSEYNLCKFKLKELNDIQELFELYSEFKNHIYDSTLEKIVNELWKDIESLYLNNRLDFNFQRFTTNINRARHYKQFRNSKFYEKIINKFNNYIKTR